MSSSDLTALLIGVAGLALLGGTVWAWRGRSRAARFWMPETLLGSWQLERCVLLGAPSFALLMLDLALLAGLGPAARPLGGAIFLLLCLPVLYFLLAFLPVPRVLYPGWAKEILDWRVHANAHLDTWLEEQRAKRDR